jgi:hypothetical protein
MPAIEISPRLAQLLTEVSLSTVRTFNPAYESDQDALREFIQLKRNLRNEHGVLFNPDTPKLQRILEHANADFDSTWLAMLDKAEADNQKTECDSDSGTPEQIDGCPYFGSRDLDNG